MAKPARVLRWASVSGRAEPSVAEKDAGLSEGDGLPAEYLNDSLGLAGDWIAWLASEYEPPHCRVTRADDDFEAISGVTAVDWTTQIDDTGAFWAVSPYPSIFTCAVAGRYRVDASLCVISSDGTTLTGLLRIVKMHVDAETVVARASAAAFAGTGIYLNAGGEIDMAAGDYFFVDCNLDGGSPPSAPQYGGGAATVRWLGPPSP